jgi:hypothetical protein
MSLFRQGLIQRYGLKYTESIENLATKQDNTNTLKELIAKKLQYDLLIKEMK